MWNEGEEGKRDQLEWVSQRIMVPEGQVGTEVMRDGTISCLATTQLCPGYCPLLGLPMIYQLPFL
jgi:hypothetical protein